MSAKPIPDGYHAITPYLLVNNVAKQIEFLQNAFGAKVIARTDTPQGTMHAELQIHDSMLMMGQVPPDRKAMPMMLYLYVEDADKYFAQAVQAGATIVQELGDQYYGDRSGGVKDINDNQWWIATRKEDLTPDEIAKRAKEKHAEKAPA